MKTKVLGVCFILSFFSEVSSARVFSFAEENFSTYLRGTGGLSNVKASAFENSSGTETSFSDQATINYSGEIGVALAVYRLTVRLGVEALFPKTLTGIKGVNSSGTELLSLTSEGLAFLPTASLEWSFMNMMDSRFFVGVAFGYGTYTMKNTYTLTAAGTAALGVTDFIEEAKSASALGGHAYAGIETLFTDNVTFALEAGYRIYQFKEFAHTQVATTIVGVVTEGAPLLNSDGGRRDLDLGGVYIGMSLRFYIDL